MMHGFIKHPGIESHLRIPVGNESGGCDLGEFEAQYPFVDFLMKGFGHENISLYNHTKVESI